MDDSSAPTKPVVKKRSAPVEIRYVSPVKYKPREDAWRHYRRTGERYK